MCIIHVDTLYMFWWLLMVTGSEGILSIWVSVMLSLFLLWFIPHYLCFLSSSKVFVLCTSFSISPLLQRPDADPGVQPCYKNRVEFSQAPADGKDPVHPRLPCRPQDIKECKRGHLQPDPSPLSFSLPLSHSSHSFLSFSVPFPSFSISLYVSKLPPCLGMSWLLQEGEEEGGGTGGWWCGGECNLLRCEAEGGGGGELNNKLNASSQPWREKTECFPVCHISFSGRRESEQISISGGVCF